MEKIQELKAKAYDAVMHDHFDGNYVDATDKIEAMKAYALLVIAEKLTVQN